MLFLIYHIIMIQIFKHKKITMPNTVKKTKKTFKDMQILLKNFNLCKKNILTYLWQM